MYKELKKQDTEKSNNPVDIVLGQLVALVLNLIGSWVGQLTSFLSLLLPGWTLKPFLG